jgi:6-phosphogluconolactonase
MSRTRPEVVVAPDAGALAALAAERFADAARAAVRERGAFHVALSGGATPQRFHARLADPAYASLPWQRTHVYFGDERCVPPDHDESNFRMARESLLANVPVPADQIYRMEGEAADPDAAARRYEAQLRTTLPHQPGGPPRFDLVWLGIGTDGHTASLFPGSDALDETGRLVIAPWADAVGAHRLTVTLPVLNAARAVIFVVEGQDKAGVVRRVLAPRGGESVLPAALVDPDPGSLIWLLDAAAASEYRPVS